jgi:hypothetical protein
VVVFFAWLFAIVWYTAICCVIVDQAEQGRRNISFSECASEALPRVPRLIGALIVLIIIFIVVTIGLAIGLSIFGVLALTSTAPEEATVAGLILGYLFILAVYLGLTVRWFLIAPVIVIEKYPGSSLGRSAKLVEGRSLKILGAYLLVYVMVGPFLLGIVPILSGVVFGLVAMPLYGLVPAMIFCRIRDAKQVAPTQWDMSPTLQQQAAEAERPGSIAPPSVAPPPPPPPAGGPA